MRVKGKNCPTIADCLSATCNCTETNYQEAVQQCPVGWTLLQAKCFRLFTNALKNTDARQACVDHGGDLFSPSNIQQNNLRGLFGMSDYSTWINAANDQVTEGSWTTVSGTPVPFTNWCANQPDNCFGSQDCVRQQLLDGCWDDIQCTSEFPFFCEMLALNGTK